MTPLVSFPEYISFNGDDVCLNKGKSMHAEKAGIDGKEK